MKYPKEYLDEIKIRLKVSTVVSKYVSLKKRGKEFVGLSPFKNEKTPSFTVNDEKGFYHCFSTSEHGNIFDFVMKMQNFKFGEAVKFLANLAGMAPYRFSKVDEQREKEWNEYTGIYSDYTNYYHNELLNNSNSDSSIISISFLLYIFVKCDGAPWQVITQLDLDIKYSRLNISIFSIRKIFVFFNLYS